MVLTPPSSLHHAKHSVLRIVPLYSISMLVATTTIADKTPPTLTLELAALVLVLDAEVPDEEAEEEALAPL